MANLTKMAQNIFGSGAGLDQISVFGSLFAGSETFTTDPATAQSLSNWLTGWYAAVIGGNAPTIQDMNALHFVVTYQLAYLVQKGVPEWDATTEYHTSSIVNVAGELFKSVQNTNVNHATSDAAWWVKIGGAVMSAVGDMIYGDVNGAQTRLPGNTSTQKQFLTQTGTGLASQAPVWQDFKPPTVQRFISGTAQTYTKPAGVLYLKVTVVGGGGGGGGGGVGSNGTPGNASSFGSNLTAGGGTQGAANGGGAGAGGANTITPTTGLTVIHDVIGGTGQVSGRAVTGGNATTSGNGGTNPMGGVGTINTGAGGAGGSNNTLISSTSAYGGDGGGAGGYIQAIISGAALASTFTYTVGGVAAGGAGAGSGLNNGGTGSAGLIVVEEFYQ